MTLPDRETTRDWLGQTVLDRDGAETGVCRALLADDATGLPEWLYAELDGETVVVPLLDATDDGDRIRVAVSRTQILGSPRMADSAELSAAQETALYEHYGISYSTAASETVLPVGDDGSPDPAVAVTQAAPTPTPASPTRPAPTHRASDDRGSSLAARRGPLAGVLALLAALGVLGTALLRRRRAARRVPEPAVRRISAAARHRLDEAAHTFVPTARAAGGMARDRAAELATAAAPVVAAAGREAQRAASAGAVTAAHAAGATARLAASTLSSGAAIGADLGSAGLRAAMGAMGAVESVPEAVAESTDSLQRGWRRGMRRLSLGLGLALGYVLGARAGRERFDQIASTAAGLAGRPEVQRAVGTVRAAVPPKLQNTLDGLTGRTPAATGGTEPPPDLPGQGL